MRIPSADSSSVSSPSSRSAASRDLALDTVTAVQPWRLPVPGPGLSLRLASGARWRYGIATGAAVALAQALAAAGAAAGTAPGRGGTYESAREAMPRGRLHHPVAKFVLLPLVLAVPAFRLHQHIAYGGSFGELQLFGLAAFARGFVLWWAAWAMGVALTAAVVRVLVEAGAALAARLRPAAAAPARRGLERAGLAVLYLGIPAWLLLRLAGF